MTNTEAKHQIFMEAHERCSDSALFIDDSLAMYLL